MELRLGIWTLPWTGCTFEEALAGARAAGYTRICLYPGHKGGPVFADDAGEEVGRTLKARLDEIGLSCEMVYGVDPQTSADNAKRRLDLAAAIGARYLIIAGTWGYLEFPGKPKPDEQLGAEQRAFVEAWRGVMPHAEGLGVVVTLKPHTGNSARWPLLRETVDLTGSPSFRACLDLGNVRFYEGLDPMVDLDVALPVAATVCLKDHSGPRAHPRFPILGDGAVDHIAFFTRLKEVGFTGPLFVERFDGTRGWAGWRFEQAVERARVSRLNVERMAAQVDE